MWVKRKIKRSVFMDDTNQSFMPHILDDTEVPSLCFMPKHYLSWFRGYRFQVSATSDGNMNLGSSATTMENDLFLAHELPNELKPLIAYSHVCESTSHLEGFWTFLENNIDLFNRFMDLTNEYSNIRCNNFNLNKISLLVKSIPLNEYDAMVSNPDNYMASKQIISWVKENKMYAPMGNLIFGRKSVTVYNNVSKQAFQILFPDYETFRENKEACEREYYGILWARLPWILFNSTGLIFTNGGCCLNRYPHNITGTIKKSDGISELRDLHDFIKTSVKLLTESLLVISTDPYS